MADFLVGKYQLVSSEKFDEYLAARGVNFMMRQMIKRLSSTLTFSATEDFYSLKTESTFSTTEIKFKLGENVDSITPDKRKTKNLFTIENGKLIQAVEDENGERETYIRSLEEDHLITTIIYKDITALRKFIRIP